MGTISCIICAYNEGERIRAILDVVTRHPLFQEIIVVNDGSTDETTRLLSHYPSITVISYSPNRGKTYALGRGIERATGQYVMLLDADLSGITSEDITALAAPVLNGSAEVSFSMRSNSLPVYRAIGIDFVTGERVLPRSLAYEFATKSSSLPRWGGEVYMNQLIVSKRLRLAIVKWTGVLNVRKYKKVGRIEGIKEELRMMRDAFFVLPLPDTLLQIFRLLRLRV